MDEYQLEIDSLRRTLADLRAREAAAAIIDEYEAELRILNALYKASRETFEAAKTDARLPVALESLGFGDWTLENVYSFVYEAAMDELPGDEDLASIINRTDYAQSLLVAFHDDELPRA